MDKRRLKISVGDDVRVFVPDEDGNMVEEVVEKVEPVKEAES
jgi:hypothetical protein